ncbi:hypothetical protein [Caulobacter sp. LARHSG274]
MAKLVGFRHVDFDTPFFINPDHVKSVRSLRVDDDEAYSVVAFGDGSEVTLNGETDFIVDKLNAAMS